MYSKSTGTSLLWWHPVLAYAVIFATASRDWFEKQDTFSTTWYFRSSLRRRLYWSAYRFCSRSAWISIGISLGYFQNFLRFWSYSSGAICLTMLSGNSRSPFHDSFNTTSGFLGKVPYKRACGEMRVMELETPMKLPWSSKQQMVKVDAKLLDWWIT